MATINLEKAQITGSVTFIISSIILPLLALQGFLFKKESDLRAYTDQQIHASEVRQNLRREEAHRLLLFRTEFLQWRIQERVRQDQQFYSLLNAIRRVEDRLEDVRRR